MATLPVSSGTIETKFINLDLQNVSVIVSSARKGINPSVFYDFAASIKMSERNLAALLNLSSRTISNYKEQKKTMGPVQVK